MNALDITGDMHDNHGAALNFGRFDVAVNAKEDEYQALKSGRCADPSKNPLSQNSACIDDQTASSLKGFFALKAAASDATERTPTWASCTEYIGRCLPRSARLANLVAVSHNLFSQSGMMADYGIEVTRLRALGRCTT